MDQAAEPTAHERWPLGFSVIEVDEVPKGEWLTHWTHDCEYVVEGDDSALDVHCGYGNGYVASDIHLWLTPSGIEATARDGSCTTLWEGEHLAGAACIVTDGRTAALEFEVYDGGTHSFGEALLGRAELGERGAVLASRVQPPQWPDSVHRARVEYESRFSDCDREHAPRFEAFGLVDAFGRRQGLWTVREIGKPQPDIEVSWRDGIPDGTYRRHESASILLEVGTFDAGFQEGQSVTWRRDGIRQVGEYIHGSLLSTTSYGPDGSKRSESKLPTRSNDDYRKKVTVLHTRR